MYEVVNVLYPNKHPVCQTVLQVNIVRKEIYKLRNTFLRDLCTLTNIVHCLHSDHACLSAFSG